MNAKAAGAPARPPPAALGPESERSLAGSWALGHTTRREGLAGAALSAQARLGRKLLLRAPGRGQHSVPCGGLAGGCPRLLPVALPRERPVQRGLLASSELGRGGEEMAPSWTAYRPPRGIPLEVAARPPSRLHPGEAAQSINSGRGPWGHEPVRPRPHRHAHADPRAPA